MTYFADNKEKVLTAKEAIQIDDSEKKFNYFGIKYTSDSYLKCSLTYSVKKETIREEFFLEPTTSEKDFYSFIDNALEKVTATSATITAINIPLMTFLFIEKPRARERLRSITHTY